MRILKIGEDIDGLRTVVIEDGDYVRSVRGVSDITFDCRCESYKLKMKRSDGMCDTIVINHVDLVDVCGVEDCDNDDDSDDDESRACGDDGDDNDDDFRIVDESMGRLGILIARR